MRYGVLAVVPMCAAVLSGCSEGVLDPKGPVASAERLILLNSTGIMLAIVIPTMLATLAVAYWFRASNSRATYLPDTDTGDIFAILVYVWRFMENLDHVPQIVQQLTRLHDIRKRIEAGASVEDIGEEIEKTAEEAAEAGRR